MNNSYSILEYYFYLKYKLKFNNKIINRNYLNKLIDFSNNI